MRFVIATLCVLLALPFPALGSGRRFTAASTESAIVESAVVTAPPFSVYACYRRAAAGAHHVLWTVTNNTNSSRYHHLWISNVDDPISVSNDNAAVGSATIATTVTANAWHRQIGTWSATNRRDVYYEGATASNTTSSTPTGINRTAIGLEADLTPALYFDGDIAWVIVWNAVLSAAEISALESGAHPMRIRPISRVGAWPMWAMHSPEINIASQGFSLTLTGTTATTGGCPLPPWSGQ